MTAFETDQELRFECARLAGGDITEAQKIYDFCNTTKYPDTPNPSGKTKKEKQPPKKKEQKAEAQEPAQEQESEPVQEQQEQTPQTNGQQPGFQQLAQDITELAALDRSAAEAVIKQLGVGRLGELDESQYAQAYELISDKLADVQDKSSETGGFV